MAAADGKVVYVGTGIRGFGQLLIVKHNATFLSAYAHNRKILVEEGQQVTRGQKIAEMGNTDSDMVKLHFEIRKQGKPIDPAAYLAEAMTVRGLTIRRTMIRRQPTLTRKRFPNPNRSPPNSNCSRMSPSST